MQLIDGWVQGYIVSIDDALHIAWVGKGRLLCEDKFHYPFSVKVWYEIQTHTHTYMLLQNNSVHDALTLWPLGNYMYIEISYMHSSKIILVLHGWGIFCEIAHRWMSLEGKSALVNGLMLSGNKPLLEPMLTHIPVIIWRHYQQATIS